jgi:glutathione S-transferase
MAAAGASYKLSYFGITALGEPIRMAFTLAGIPFEDNRCTGEQWGEMKTQPKFAGNQMPLLEVKHPDGSEQLMAQSRAILRYVGSIGKYNDAPLYPSDPMQRYYCDEAIELIEDFRPAMIPTFAIQDQAEKEAARLALVRPGGKIYDGLKKLNERLGKFAFSAGDAPSVADCYVVSVVYLFQQPTFLDGFPADTFAEFPNIVALKDRLCSLPPLKAYYASAEGIRESFKVA